MWRHNVVSLQCDAAHLPLEDASVDLIVTSPPYFALRDYRGDGESLPGQLGSECTPQEFVKSLLTCTREWMRVLKPRGSVFVNLGDKYAASGNGPSGCSSLDRRDRYLIAGAKRVNNSAAWGFRAKSMIGIPERYMLGCVDDLGLILRQKIVWRKNGLPESVRDRCCVVHELVYHFTKEGDYYNGVARIREEQAGKLPPSVWDISTQPLNIPKYLAEESLDGSAFDFDHFAAFPEALPQKIILGWSPKDVCTKCGQGRFPVSEKAAAGRHDVDRSPWQEDVQTRIIGNACACTPYTDHPGGSGRKRTGQGYAEETGHDAHPHGGVGLLPRTGPWREYLLDEWEPAPSVPGTVCDPCGGTGTTAITAAKLSRRGITCDLSYDYAKRLVEWRMYDLSQNRRKL